MTLRAHAEALYDLLKPLLDSHDSTKVQSTIERELRHLVPTWKDSHPDCPGWYWFKPNSIAEPRLLLISHGRIDTKLMADLGPPNNLVDVQRIQGKWAGPLLPPA